MPDVAAFENNRPLGFAPGWCDKEGPPVAADDAVLHGDRHRCRGFGELPEVYQNTRSSIIKKARVADHTVLKNLARSVGLKVDAGLGTRSACPGHDRVLDCQVTGRNDA